MEEKIDVLLTTYNTNIDYLKQQLDSILNQTYRNFDLIISDDCSNKSEVKEILTEYAEKDNRIKLYFQDKNLGYTKNFEFVLTKSKSDYIAFSDHDDIWYSNKLEECIKTLKEKDVDLVYCDANQIDKDGNVIQQSYLKYKNMPILNKSYNRILPFTRHIAIGCSQLFTRQVKEIMLPFTENTIVHDWHSLYIADKLKGIYCVDKPLFGYRIHSNNAFGGRNLKQNMKIWKNENGNNFSSYTKYRKKVITDTYLAGVKMCRDFSNKFSNNDLKYKELEVIQYFEKSQRNKIIYLPIHRYFEFMNFKGIGKRKYKEIMILHFPIISYFIFKFL